ncbi:MAG: class C beta-lactamase-related serine hydrolase [bacterium TMED46]|nr:MAG: class C beta-lactamase-related serine hydrolase [bacterium TMED46]
MLRYSCSKLNIYLLVSVVILYTPVLSQSTDLSLEWTTNNNIPFLTELENTIEDEVAVLSTVKGIIVIYKGQVVLENYYNGSSVDDVYNIWSVTKSFISTLVGQAVDMGMMDDPDSSASNFFPDYDIDYVESIKLHHLLGMSSGYQEDWGFLSNSTEEILSGEANGPGAFFYNNNACHLNAHALYYGTGQTPHEFASTYLFPFLGIEDPPWSDGYLDINNGSYGLQLNLRDMVKLGQLYIQDGFSGNEQVLSTEWIERATSPQVDTNWGNYGYGYLWWLPQIGLSYQASGAGYLADKMITDIDLDRGSARIIALGSGAAFLIRGGIGIALDEEFNDTSILLNLAALNAGWYFTFKTVSKNDNLLTNIGKSKKSISFSLAPSITGSFDRPSPGLSFMMNFY